MLLSSFIDISHPENLRWLAILGSSIILSLASSIVPNYVETTLDLRSHNRSRLFNETAARLHIAYIIFLLALIKSDDIHKTGNIQTWLDTLFFVLVCILIVSIIMSGRTIQRIQRYKDWNGKKHQCNQVNGVCDTPIGWWMYFKVCFLNGLVALVVGLLCLWLSVSPSIIKHDKSSASSDGFVQGQQKGYYEVLRGLYKQIALETKNQFEETVLGIKDNKLKDDKLYVSYWFSHKEVVHQLATTHEETAADTHPVNVESIIGCAFVNANSSVRWEGDNNQATVWPYNDERSTKSNCQYKKLDITKFKLVICATYNNSGSKKPEDTVGICVFTPNQIKVPNNNYHVFLKAKAEEFHKTVLPLLKNKTLIPQ